MEPLAARLSDCLELLTGGSRVALPHHQTLRATLDWSYALLGDGERVVLRRLAVFSGGWTLDAAESVCGDADLPAAAVVDAMVKLVEKSLVVVEPADVQPQRYRLLETVRFYAREKLRLADEEARLRALHCAWCLALAEEAEPFLYTAKQIQWLARFDHEHDNLRAALTWSAEQAEGDSGVRICAALAWFWYLRGHLSDGQRWTSAAIVQSATARPSIRARALLGAGWMAYGSGDLARAETHFRAGLVAARLAGDPRIIAAAVTCVGFTLRDRGAFEAARPALDEGLSLANRVDATWDRAFARYLLCTLARLQGDVSSGVTLAEESRTLFGRLGERLGISAALQELARCASERGDDARAMSLYEEALVQSRELGNRRGMALSLNGLGSLALAHGDWRRAYEFHQHALELYRELGNADRAGDALDGLAVVAVEVGEAERGARLFGAAAGLRAEAGVAKRSSMRGPLRYDHALSTAKHALGVSRFDAAWTAGYGLSLEESARCALEPSRAEPIAVGSLTPRETQVATLVARGLSNREIAERLAVATRTAEHHLENMLAKLELTSRTQLGIWAVQHGLATEPSTRVPYEAMR